MTHESETKSVALIDLSFAFRRNYHHLTHEPASEAVHRTIQDIEKWAADYDGVALCADRPPYKRSEMLPDYKGQRTKPDPLMYEQMKVVEEECKRLGYAVVGAQGYEADDIIATLTATLNFDDTEVDIFSGDMDLIQLVTSRVTVVSPQTKKRMTPDEVMAWKGLRTAQFVDYLALAGKKSNNYHGVTGIGDKTAAKLLIYHGSVANLMHCCEKAATESDTADGVTPKQQENLLGAKKDVVLGQKLVSLMYDAPLEPSVLTDIFSTSHEEYRAPMDDEPPPYGEEPAPQGELTSQEVKAQLKAVPEPPAQVVEAEVVKETTDAPAPAENALVATDGASWSRALEPQDSTGAWKLAQILHNSRLFGQFPRAEAILAIILTGRSMGLDAVRSLRSFHVIEGKVCPTSSHLVGMVMASPICEYFQLVESTATTAVYETQRRGNPSSTRMEFTMKDADLQGLSSKHNWRKMPKQMLRARCSTQLARAVYPDVVAGLYSSEEMTDAA